MIKRMNISEAIHKLQEILDFYGDMPLQAVDSMGEPTAATLMEETNEEGETVAVTIVDAEEAFIDELYEEEDESA